MQIYLKIYKFFYHINFRFIFYFYSNECTSSNNDIFYFYRTACILTCPSTRILVSNQCLCTFGTFDNGVTECAACHSSWY